jgi:type I restriction enzyme S subunit
MGSSPKSECYNQSEIGLPLLQGNADIKNRLSAPRIFTSEITKECTIGDILLSVRAPVGSVAKSVHHACIGRGIAAIHAKPANSQEFLYQWLISYEPQWVNISQGGTFDAINSDDLRQVGLAVPLPPEQQKIAECLSSLDELIAAQARKVDALKAHKKGLMQQLFPREGETQPRLRFPEFQDSEGWQTKFLGDLCKIRTGKKDANEGASDGQYPFFTCAENHIFSHTYSFDAEAILIAGNANVGQTRYYRGKFEAYQRTYVLTDFSGIDVPYLYSILNAKLRVSLLEQVQVSAMSYIKLPMLQEYPLPVPPSPAEQQIIAECLTSLDDLITAETQKIEALKTHKKGLMQQLFPSLEEG